MADYFKGTVLAAPIVNSSANDTYATHHSVLGSGGYQEVVTIDERNQIPVDELFPTIDFDGISSGRRRLGMLVYVLDTDTIYKLHPKVGSDYITYSGWTGYTDTQKYLALSANTSWYPLFDDNGTTIGSGTNISKAYAQTTHGFVYGDVIGYNGSEFVKVNSSTALTIEPLGVISKSDSTTTNSGFTITFAGYVNTTGFVDYTGGTLVNGKVYYLADSSYNGKLSLYKPTGITDVSKPMLVKTALNNAIVLQYRGISKTEEGLTLGDFNTYTGDTQLFLDKTVTGATNIGYFSGKTGIQILDILTSDPLYNGDYVSEYNHYYRDLNGVIQLGSPTYHGVLRRGYVSSFSPTKSWLYNTYTGSSNQIGWILVDGDISENIGSFLTANPNSGIPTFVEEEWSYTGGTMFDGYYSNSSISLDVSGDLYTGDTYSIGGPVYRDKEFKELKMRTMISKSPDTIIVTFDDNFIYVSGRTSGSTFITGVTSAANIGAGYGVFNSLVGDQLQFRSLVPSGYTAISYSGDNIIITSSSPTDTVTGATNIGSGTGIYDSTSSYSLMLKSLIGSGLTTVYSGSNEITIYTSGITTELFDSFTGVTDSNFDILRNVNKINDIKLAQVLNLSYNNSTSQIETINLTGLSSVETYISGFTKYDSTDFGTAHSMLYLNGYVYLSTRQMPARIAKVNSNDLTDIEIFTYSGSNSSSLFSIADRLIYSDYTGKLYIPFGDPDYNRDLKIIEFDPDNISGFTEVVNESGVFPGFPTGIAIGNKLYILTGYLERLLEYDLDTFTLSRSLVLPNNSTPYALNSDGVNLYYTEIYSGSKVTKVSLDTFTITDSFALPTEYMIDEFAIVGDYLWIGHETELGGTTYKGIYIVNKNDLSDYHIIYIENNDSNWGIFYDNVYVWAIFASDPGIILRIDPQTFKVDRKVLDSTIIRPNSMAFDGTNYYVSTFEVPTIMTKFTTPTYFNDMYYAGNNKEVLLKISQTNKNITLTDTIVTGNEGIKYSHDVSSGFTYYSLPNLGYISGLTTVSVTGATNLGLGENIFYSKTGQTLQFNTIIGSGNTTVSTSGNTIIVNSIKDNIYSTEIITGSTTLTTDSSFVILVDHLTPITINLPLTPTPNQVFKIKDVSGNAISNNVIVSGNTKNIDGDTYGTINTNYGSFELLYNLTLDEWFSLSVI